MTGFEIAIIALLVIDIGFNLHTERMRSKTYAVLRQKISDMEFKLVSKGIL